MLVYLSLSLSYVLTYVSSNIVGGWLEAPQALED